MLTLVIVVVGASPDLEDIAVSLVETVALLVDGNSVVAGVPPAAISVQHVRASKHSRLAGAAVLFGDFHSKGSAVGDLVAGVKDELAGNDRSGRVAEDRPSLGNVAFVEAGRAAGAGLGRGSEAESASARLDLDVGVLLLLQLSRGGRGAGEGKDGEQGKENSEHYRQDRWVFGSSECVTFFWWASGYAGRG